MGSVHLQAFLLEGSQGQRNPAAVPAVSHQGRCLGGMGDAFRGEKRVVVRHVGLERAVSAYPDSVAADERRLVRGEEGRVRR